MKIDLTPFYYSCQIKFETLFSVRNAIARAINNNQSDRMFVKSKLKIKQLPDYLAAIHTLERHN